MENPYIEIKDIKARFNNSIDRNFNSLESYFDYKLIQLCELVSLRNEVINCLLLELFQASIFTTNHLVERLIKMSLIKAHTIQFDYSQLDNYTEKLKESEAKFDSKKLSETLKLAVDDHLITQEQFAYLSDIRKNIRNPYSHAEIAKINKENPKAIVGFMFNIEDVKKSIIKNEQINLTNQIEIPSFSPAIAQMYQEQNAKEIALEYFERVYEIIIHIEKILTDRNPRKQAFT